MNNKKFFESFRFRMFSLDKGRHTDNYTNGGLNSNYICLLVKGSARLVSDGGTVYLKENDFFFIPKSCPYHSYWYTDGEDELTWYSFGVEALPVPDGGNYILQKIEADVAARAVFDKITESLKVCSETIGLLYMFFGMVSPFMKRAGSSYDASAERAVEYMRNNPQAKMSEVADFCDISEATLYNLFKKRFKKTPNEVRQRILCEKAEELLVTTDLSVEEISGRMGFSSSSYFRKIMKKHLDTTPTAIRKNSV